MKGHRERIRLHCGHSFRALRWSRNLRDVDLLLPHGRTERIVGEGLHWHYHLAMELTLFTRGEGTRFVGDHIGPFAAGDLVLLGEKLPHHWHPHGDSEGVSVQWHFPPSHPFWAFPETVPLATLFAKAGRGLHITGRTAETVVHSLRTLTQTSGAARLSALLDILARLADAPIRECSLLSIRSFSLPAESQHQRAIGDAVRHLIANFRDEVCLDDVLRLTRLSRPTFARQFKKHSGHTFSAFLNRLRLQAACRELGETDHSVLDIALGCGFTQVSFFNRIFRRLMHRSPSEYRTQCRRKGRKP